MHLYMETQTLLQSLYTPAIYLTLRTIKETFVTNHLYNHSSTLLLFHFFSTRYVVPSKAPLDVCVSIIYTYTHTRAGAHTYAFTHARRQLICFCHWTVVIDSSNHILCKHGTFSTSQHCRTANNDAINKSASVAKRQREINRTQGIK